MLTTNQRGCLISAVAANAAAASRTASFAVERARTARFTAVLTWSAATALNAELYTSVDGGSHWGRVQSISVAAGLGTLSDYQPDKAVGASVSIDLSLDVEAATHVRVILSATGGGASDLLSLYAATSEEN